MKEGAVLFAGNGTASCNNMRKLLHMKRLCGNGRNAFLCGCSVGPVAQLDRAAAFFVFTAA